MWHKITTHVSKSYKGWRISIGHASKWNKHLAVTITPAITPNHEFVNSLPEEDKLKLFKDIFALDKKYCYRFEVANLYPFIYPWGEAENRAYHYINNNLGGKFDIEKAMKSL